MPDRSEPLAADQPASPDTAADPIVANVEGHPIFLSEVGRASRTLPDNLRVLPFETLYPALLDRMIDHAALVMMAQRAGLDSQPEVRRDIRTATDKIMEAAYLGREVAPKVTEAAIQARYTQLYAGRPATEEVRARHILLATEADARKVLNDLRHGGDFAAIARAISRDPDASQGGDLGFFRREQVWPGFADVAFSLQPGQVGPEPVRNEFGWHVIQLEERRLVATPGFSQVHDELRQDLLADWIQRSVAQARAQLLIHRFNLDGSELDSVMRPKDAGTSPR